MIFRTLEKIEIIDNIDSSGSDIPCIKQNLTEEFYFEFRDKIIETGYASTI